jgi:peptidyl-prolyl cis-trans isomerase D
MIRFLQTPGPALKIALSAILVVICGSMVVTLIPGFGSNLGLGGPAQGVVATVGNQQITVPDVQREARQMLKQQFPQGNAQEAMFLPFFAQQATDRLIMQKAVLVEAERLGLRATNDELKDELQHGAYGATFFPGGTFVGEQQYQNMLEQANLTVPQFEAGVKEEILFNKLRDLVTGSALVTDAEVRQEFEKRYVKVKFDYAVLRKDDLLKDIHPSEEELKAFFAHNQAAYKNSIPEKRKLRYAVVNAAKIEAQTEVSRQDLQAYYNEHRDEFRVGEQVNVRHILIKTPAGADGKVDPQVVAEARKKAEDVLKQLKAGANFADLAQKYSEDPGSAKQGGSLSWIQRGRTVPEFEKAAFSLPKGGTSELVQTSFGFHIIHVDDRQEAHLKTLDEVKAQIEPLMKQQKAGQAAQAEADTLLSAARKDGLDKAAAAKGLEVISTDFVSQSDVLPGIGASPQFMSAVFGEQDKAPPDVFQVAQDYVVFEVVGQKPAATPTFEEIRARVETEFKNQRVAQLLTQKTQELSDRAKAEHDLKKAAKELGAAFKTSDLVQPDGQVPDLGSMAGGASVAFTMQPGAISGPIDNGSTGAVVELLERLQAAAADFPAKEDQLREALLQKKRQEVFGLFLGNLRAEMGKSGKIKINQQELNNLTRSQAEGE